VRPAYVVRLAHVTLNLDSKTSLMNYTPNWKQNCH